MITISLDESYVFDILSIYQVKKIKSPDNPIHANNFDRLYSEIELQIGTDKISEILSSEEFINLFEANSKTFDLVDLVKQDPCKGKELDDCNYNRYLKKIALQEKFFCSKITELKIGYSNN
jgi:hypothetical protein